MGASSVGERYMDIERDVVGFQKFAKQSTLGMWSAGAI